MESNGWVMWNMGTWLMTHALSASGHLNVPTLTLAVVTTFHTALAKTADAQTKVPKRYRMMPRNAQTFFFGRWIYLCCYDEFSCNHLQSSAIVLLFVIVLLHIFSTNLEICVVLRCFWARGWIWSDLIGRTNWDLGCFLILFRHESEIGNDCPSKILVLYDSEFSTPRVDDFFENKIMTFGRAMGTLPQCGPILPKPHVLHFQPSSLEKSRVGCWHKFCCTGTFPQRGRPWMGRTTQSFAIGRWKEYVLISFRKHGI